MKKYLLLFIFCLTLLLLVPVKVVRANFVADDGGIQKFHTQSVPQINSTGKIQSSYTNGSFFPLGLYWYDSRYLQQIKDAGFNMVYSALWDPGGHHATLADLDKLNQYGIKVIPDIHNTLGGAVLDANAVANFINSYKTHPALLAWYLTAENTPDLTTSQWNSLYRQVKALDPNRAIMGEVGIHGGAGPTGLPFSVDMSNIYSYNIYSEQSSIDDLAYSIDSYMNRGNPWPLFTILQAFKQGDDVSYAAWKFMPTPEQIRAQMYTAIAHGATGLWLFVGFPDATTHNTGEKLTGLTPDIPQWNAASVANHEIEANKRIFLSKTSLDGYHVFVQRGNANCKPDDYHCRTAHPMQTILKDTGEQNVRYLLAVNIDYYGLDGKFSFAQNPVRVTSVLDGRTMTPSGNGFTDSFGGFGVHLYRIEFNGGGSYIPNCTITAGPSQITLGQTANFTATFSSPQANLGTKISIGQNGRFLVDLDGNGSNNGSSASQTFSWTPTATGTYDLFCRAWNDGVAECDGNDVYAKSNPYKPYTCTGPNAYMTVNVVASIPGDLNRDGRVDIVDLRQLLTNFTGIFDYNLVVGNYGRGQ